MKDDYALQTDFVAGYFLGCWGRKYCFAFELLGISLNRLPQLYWSLI